MRHVQQQLQYLLGRQANTATQTKHPTRITFTSQLHIAACSKRLYMHRLPKGDVVDGGRGGGGAGTYAPFFIHAQHKIRRSQPLARPHTDATRGLPTHVRTVPAKCWALDSHTATAYISNAAFVAALPAAPARSLHLASINSPTHMTTIS